MKGTLKLNRTESVKLRICRVSVSGHYNARIGNLLGKHGSLKTLKVIDFLRRMGVLSTISALTQFVVGHPTEFLVGCRTISSYFVIRPVGVDIKDRHL